MPKSSAELSQVSLAVTLWKAGSISKYGPWEMDSIKQSVSECNGNSQSTPVIKQRTMDGFEIAQVHRKESKEVENQDAKI